MKESFTTQSPDENGIGFKKFYALDPSDLVIGAFQTHPCWVSQFQPLLHNLMTEHVSVHLLWQCVGLCSRNDYKISNRFMGCHGNRHWYVWQCVCFLPASLTWSNTHSSSPFWHFKSIFRCNLGYGERPSGRLGQAKMPWRSGCSAPR